MLILTDQIKSYKDNNYKLEIFTADSKSYNFKDKWDIIQTEGITWAVHNDDNKTITYVNLSEAISFVISK